MYADNMYRDDFIAERKAMFGQDRAHLCQHNDA